MHAMPRRIKIKIFIFEGYCDINMIAIMTLWSKGIFFVMGM